MSSMSSLSIISTITPPMCSFVFLSNFLCEAPLGFALAEVCLRSMGICREKLELVPTVSRAGAGLRWRAFLRWDPARTADSGGGPQRGAASRAPFVSTSVSGLRGPRSVPDSRSATTLARFLYQYFTPLFFVAAYSRPPLPDLHPNRLLFLSQLVIENLQGMPSTVIHRLGCHLNPWKNIDN